ncbi:MAG: ankyrin repeat domain-containing protein [Vicinamibacteraceae bacterium]
MMGEALALTAWLELSTLAKATGILMLGFGAVSLAARARAAVRHLSVAAAFGALLLLPLVTLTVPAVTIEVPVWQAEGSGTFQDGASRDTRTPPGRALASGWIANASPWSAPSWPAMAKLAWVGGALFLLLSLAVDLARLQRIRRDGLPWLALRESLQSLAQECGVRRSVDVLLHENVPGPLTCGLWRPAIVLPPDAPRWPEAHLHRTLIHELEHVRRGDWITQLLARAICAGYWLHPLVWVAWRRLRLEAERACDDAVVQRAECAEYAEQLVELARRMSPAHARPALSMANRSDLSTRVSALLDQSQRRGRAGRWTAAAAIGGAALAVLALAPVRTIAQSSERAAGPSQPLRSSPLDRALFEVAENGNIDEIDALISGGANVDAALPGDGTPLIGAARRGHVDAVQRLLDQGADPNMPVRGDANPLIMAAREGHAEVVALLLDRGADIEQIVPEDENALIQASRGGHLRVVELLVARGADVNARAWTESNGGEWRTPLNMARRGGHDAVVKLLLASGATH